MYRCVCGLYLCCKHVCTSFTHTHSIWARALFFVPRFRCGTEVVHSCVHWAAFHSATPEVEPWPKKKSQRRETNRAYCALLPIFTQLFLQCVFMLHCFELLRSFLWITATSTTGRATHWRNNNKEKVSELSKLLSSSCRFEKLIVIAATKVPHPEDTALHQHT